MTNIFKKGSTQYIDFETMSDLKWHCTKCELKSGQAKTWQVWRQEKGIQLDTDEHGNFFKKQFCKNCNLVTVHRKLKSTKIINDTKLRYAISSNVANKVKKIYENIEAVLLRKMSDKELEIDHKFPQIRWKTNKLDFNNYSDMQLKNKFLLLNRQNNLLKSRQCEKCFKTNLRGSFPGIHFWYKGNQNWNGKNKHDENGCVGCFWYDPFKWREKLNEIISSDTTKDKS